MPLFVATACCLTGKTLSITRGLTSQQLLLLRQTTLHQQAATTGTPTVQPLQTQAAVVQQKLSLPSGIEQLRATVASAASVLPRFAGIAATSGGTVKGIAGGRAFQTEEVLALLKQQSIRMSATQPAQLTSKPQQVTSYQATVKPASSTSTSVVTQQNVNPTTTTTTQGHKTHIQTLAAQQKNPTVQPRASSDRK